MFSNLKKLNSHIAFVWPEILLVLFFQYFIFFYNNTYYLKIIDWLEQFIVHKEIKRQYFNFFDLDLIIPNFLNGLKYNYLVPSEFHLTTISEYFIGVYNSELMIDLIGKLLIFAISSKTLYSISQNLPASIVGSSFISFSDYWPTVTLTMLALMISINIFVETRDKEISNFQLAQILFLPFLFEVQHGGIFIFLFSYLIVLNKLRFSQKFVAFNFINFITMLLPNYRLFYEIIFVKTNVRSFNGNFFNSKQLNEFLIQFIKINSDGQHHFLTSNHRYVFLIVNFYLFYLVIKRITSNKFFSDNETLFIKVYLLIQIFNLFYAVDHSNLLSFNALFSTRLHLFRISIFNQFLWGLLLCFILSKLNKRSLNIGLILLSFTLNGSAMHKISNPESFENLPSPLNSIATNFGQRVNYADFLVMNIFNSYLPEQSTYATFYSTIDDYYFIDQFENLKKDLDKDLSKYRFVSYDLDPMIPAYSGLYTIDGYFNLYDNEYRNRFRKVIRKELDYLGKNALWFDDYGAKVQLFFKEKYGSFDLQNINFSELKNLETTHFVSTKLLDYKYLELFKQYDSFVIYKINYSDC